MSEYSASPRVRVDWTIPIWSVIGLIGQALVIAWWGATIQARVAALEVANQGSQATPATVARLDERSKAQSDALTRIEARLDALEGDKLEHAK